MTMAEVHDELAHLVAELRRRRAEMTDVEVKAARQQAPKSVRETLSAFANGRGGVVLLGLDEASYAPVPGFDPDGVREALAGMASNDLTPPVRGLI